MALRLVSSGTGTSLYDCFRAYPTRPFFDLYVHVSLRSAIRHADRFAAFGCSLSRRSPYTYKSKSFRFRASSTRPFFDLYVHGSLLRAKKACPCSFIHLLLGQADKYHPAVPPGLTLFRAHSAIHRYTSSIKKLHTNICRTLLTEVHHSVSHTLQDCISGRPRQSIRQYASYCNLSTCSSLE